MNAFNRNLQIRIRIAATSFLNEMQAVFTDRGALLILIGAMFIYPVVYSIAYKNNVLTDIPVAVVDYDNTAASRQLSRMVDATEKLMVVEKPLSLADAEALFWDSKVRGIVVIEKGFEKNTLSAHTATVGVYCDASYFLLYKETLTASLQASATYGAGVEIRRFLASGSSLPQAMVQSNPLQAKYYSLYNPAGGYGSFVMPGIILVILQQTMLIGIGMVSGASREKKLTILAPGIHFKGGTLSTLMGRSLAYFFIMLFTSTFGLLWIYNWFGFPSKCSYLYIMALLVPFAFSTIFLGLAISFLFHKREQSIMFLVFLSPIVLFMSGVSWPVESMSPVVQYLSKLLPSSFMVPAYLRLRTMGVSLADVRPELWALFVQTILYLSLAVLFYKIMKHRQQRGNESKPPLSLRRKVIKRLKK